jgi:uncharacterized protein
MTRVKIKSLIIRNRQILKKYNVDSIALFGSFSRNNQVKSSDIDLLVDFNEPTYDNYVGLKSDLEDIFKRKVDLVNVKALKERIKPYILKDATWLEEK